MATTVDQDLPIVHARRGAGERRVAVWVSSDIGAIEAEWRAAEDRLVATPYQRFDAVRAWYETLGRAEGYTPCLVVARSAGGAPTFLLPLAVKAKGPVRFARIAGGPHTNFTVPVFDAAVWQDATAADAADLMTEAGRAAGIDLFLLPHVPRRWNGHDNPLAKLPARPSANPAYRGALGRDVEATLRELRGTSGLRKLRAKERKLVERGTLAHVVARTADERAMILDAFQRQKSAWFAREGIDDIFAPAEARAFFQTMAERGVFELHALTLDGEAIAVFGGAVHQGRFTTSINSYAFGEIARLSPGELLLRHLIAHAAAGGAGTFDLGVGEAEYKRHWLHEQEDLLDIAYGVDAIGTLAAAAAGTAFALKRRVKASPRLTAIANRLRGRKTEAPKPDKDAD